MMAISKKIEGFISQSSWIRKMFEDGIRLKKEYGEDKVFDFSLGNPNISPPERFKELMREVAADDSPGVHAYMPNSGNPEARAAIADYLSKEHSVNLSAENVIMSCGAGGALNVALKTLLDPGDEVVIPAPFFVEYRFYVDNCGGVTKLVETKDDFSLDLEAIRNAITDKTKVILINSPNNPTGKVYDEKSVTGLAKILEEKSIEIGQEIYLISDEPYRDIVFDGVKVPSVLKIYRNSIIATSYSKSISIPGERIGFLAINPEIADCELLTGGMILCTRILGFVNAPAFMQRVIGKMQGTLVDIEEYKRKRDLLCDGLSSAGYRFEKPEAAFYLFPRSPIEDDVEFVKALQKKNILTVPGSGFGRSGHFRIAYCVDDGTIVNSMEGFKQVINS
ncbi:MAG: pyridoxal phosphate-dependent aminotransferase, partial [Thermodesulfobacteriota bacterium]|nr:pyridoxal phosphate-dependent aminotransferase [Thermodesulfobacteriota bacterium]